MRTSWTSKSHARDEILEQLHWRRWVIRNNFAGDLDRFHQEFPSTPLEAFMTTGRHVFNVGYVRRMQNRVKALPEPKTGRLEPKGPLKSRSLRGVTVHFRPVEFVEGPINDDRRPGWRSGSSRNRKTDEEPKPGPVRHRWGRLRWRRERRHRGVSRPLASVTTGRAAGRGVPVKIDPDELALEAYKACLFYNMPWVAIEVTGGWGGPR
jgi:hypothetical protein